jgi:Kef-type K+ transport system membrane component KefB
MMESPFVNIILLFGITIVLVTVFKAVLRKTVIPALVGFIVIGFLLNIGNNQWNIFTEESRWIFQFLAKVGIITLLFKIGLESNIKGLLEQLRKASVIWISGILVTALLGYAAASYVFQIDLIPAVFIAVALTATSVGVPVGVWQEAKALKSKRGELLIDVAELDDISGIILMVLLFAITPVLQETGNTNLLSRIGSEFVIILVKFSLFTFLCLLFSLYLEKRVTKTARKILSVTNSVLLSLGIGLLIAAGAAYLGFSVAIGAFFAGIAFSRDPEKVQLDKSFELLHELFSPFFFIGIGLTVVVTSILPALGLGTVLLTAAILGKIFGHGTPAYFTGGWQSFFLIGVSMVPRAEITMIIMDRGRDFGKWAVSSTTFAAMVLVSLTTCMLSPILIKKLLHIWPQTMEN